MDPVLFESEFQPSKVQTEDGRVFFALAAHGPSAATVRLITGRSLLGHKAHVAILLPDGEGINWRVRVLWTTRLADGLYENGATLLQTWMSGF